MLYLKGILSLILHTSNVPNFTHAHLCSHTAVPREPQGNRRVEMGRGGEVRGEGKVQRRERKKSHAMRRHAPKTKYRTEIGRAHV